MSNETGGLELDAWWLAYAAAVEMSSIEDVARALIEERSIGAAVAFGLMGMAEAIRDSRPVEPDVWCNCGDWTEEVPLICPLHDVSPPHESTCPLLGGGTFCSCSLG